MLAARGRLVGCALVVIALCAPVAARASGSYYRGCSYSTGKQSPQVRALLTHGLACRSARRLISDVRSSDDWRGAYFSDDVTGSAGYLTGGYDADGYLKERTFTCRYRLVGLTSKYVLAACRDDKDSHVTVSAQFHGR